MLDRRCERFNSGLQTKSESCCSWTPDTGRVERYRMWPANSCRSV